MVKSTLALLVLTGLVASCNAAEPSVEANLKKIIQPRLNPGMQIDSVKATQFSGLYEVRAGGDIIYTDKAGDYIFIGEIVDAKTRKNLTKERLEEINKIKFSDLPLENAVKLVKGNGKRVIAIFEDPNCGYCKRFRQTTLKEADNLTVYTFMYNILSEDSAIKSRNIWCAPNRHKAWDDWMIDGKLPASAAASCESPNDKVSALGRKLRINGTPAIFFADGSRISGAIDLDGLEAKLKTLK